MGSITLRVSVVSLMLGLGLPAAWHRGNLCNNNSNSSRNPRHRSRQIRALLPLPRLFRRFPRKRRRASKRRQAKVRHRTRRHLQTKPNNP